jgi:hypothetical protein
MRREKARPFHPRTIKVSGEKPANTREFPSPFRAGSMFAEGEVAWEKELEKEDSLGRGAPSLMRLAPNSLIL